MKNMKKNATIDVIFMFFMRFMVKSTRGGPVSPKGYT